MNLTTATPVEIDTEIARINGELNAIFNQIDAAKDAIQRYEDSDANRRRTWPVIGEKAAQAVAALPGLRATAEELRDQLRPLHDEFGARGGWERYYLVEGGHLHYDVSSYRCSRIATTSHYWLTELSGQAAAEVIELAGERVCTVCFPDAPVAVQERPSKLFTKTEQEKEEARVARAEKAAAKAKKTAAAAITTPSGTELRTHNSLGVIKTERAAAIELVDALWYEEFYGTAADRIEDIEVLTAALAWKRGTTPADELAAAQVRLAARIKREG
jgi:hypothetical protein